MLAPFILLTSSLLALATEQQQPLSIHQPPHPDNQLAVDFESLLIQLSEQLDVVDVMRMTGHGAGLDDNRVVHVFGEEEPRTMTEGEKLRLKKAGYQFMDITDHPSLGSINALRQSLQASPDVFADPATVAPKPHIKSLLRQLDDKYIREDITKLSSFWNRNYKSETGLASSNWVAEHVQEILDSTPNSETTTSVTKFDHRFLQKSVIARIESSDSSIKSEDKELVMIGAHQDSLNYLLPFYRAPGADDDGSGSVTVMQVLRSLVEDKFVPPPHIALEFHWYAAEEGGLLGSQDVASAYEKAGKNVKGLLQMDMVAFVKNGTTPKVGVFDNQVDQKLTSFTTKLIEAYLPLPWNFTGCGSTCGSDHMSWTKAGYRAAFVTESLFEDAAHKYIHTSKDDMNQDGQYSIEHMMEYVKLGIAFVTELSTV